MVTLVFSLQWVALQELGKVKVKREAGNRFFFCAQTNPLAIIVARSRSWEKCAERK
jgi:hypothetical protein